ncbi:MAG: hypothetical protein AAGH41_10460 [Pseudomonadota bacterium]
MKIQAVEKLSGVRGINPIRFLVLVLAFAAISGVVALSVTNTQMQLVEALPEETVARNLSLNDLLIEAERQQRQIGTDASIATVQLMTSRDLVRCGQAPSLVDQGRVQLVGESLVTAMGLSASPLLGFVGLNAYQRYQCGWETSGAGDDAPWFMADTAFAIMAAMVLLIVFKDVLLSWLPPAKAALDGIEQLIQLAVAPVTLGTVATMFTNETGTIFAEGAVEVAALLGGGEAGLSVMHAGLPLPSVGDIGSVGTTMFLGNFLAAMVGTAVSSLLFVAGSLVAGLVLLMPVPLLDSLLRSTRGGAMAGMAGTAAVAPELSLVVAIPVFILAMAIFPFALRLMVFGTVNALDFLPFNRSRGMGSANFVRAFSGKAMPGLPKRTAGRIKRDDDGTLLFVYAPFYIFPRRAYAIDESNPMTVVEGVLMPSLRMGFRGTGPAAFLLPARYRKHGRTIAERLKLAFAIKGLDGTVADGGMPPPTPA